MGVDRYKRGQIWWHKSNNIYNGSVQGGARPVVIVSNDKANKFSKNVTIVPCTSADKKDLPTHFKFILDEHTTVLCEQITTIPMDELTEYIGTCDNYSINQLNKALSIAIDLDNLIKDTGNNIHIEDNIIEVSQQVNNIVHKRGRPVKYTPEYISKFVADYDSYGLSYMVENYKLSKKDIKEKIRKFKSEG